ncbi:FAD-dependent monooxygenase [Paraglaciecola sp.]|uniref:FAD-dependent monooxygenase n=1 Tax=Paraglaciecola sp. TaxID=1920173 RepID=UPI003EF1F63E
MPRKIAIAGAGIGGLCAALALTKKGFQVDVFERSKVLGEVGAGLQLSPNAMHVLQALGLADKIKALSFAPHAAVMRHYKTGNEYFCVPLKQHCKQTYGAEYLHIHRADLHHVLFTACVESGVKVHLGKNVDVYEINGSQVDLKFENGESQITDILIGADGIRSKVQACMLGAHKPEFTGQVAWRGVVPASSLPQHLVKPNANLWVGPGQHFVSYYLRGGELVNFVAVEERNDWRQESWTEPGDINQLRSRFKGWHPEVTEVLDATESCFLWALYGRKPLDKWVDNNVALLGDACHPMLPFLAQGAAMAIEDAYVLAECLNHSIDTPTGLMAYQNQRMQRTSNIQREAAKNASLYHMSTPVDRTKLSILGMLSKLGISDKLAAKKLDGIYSYNVVKSVS